MSEIPGPEDWVWIILQKSGRIESILGRADTETGAKYVPAFFSKEEAMACKFHLAGDVAEFCEAQAIIYEDLENQCREGGLFIYFVSATGAVLHKVTP